MTEADAPDDVVAVVDTLLARKAAARELGSAALPEAVRDFIDEEFRLARSVFEGSHVRPAPEAIVAADTIFQEMVTRLDEC